MSILHISNIVKNLPDNQINQIKNFIKLTLRLLCHAMALSCNNDKKNIITKRIVISLAVKEQKKQFKFFYGDIMKHFT